MKRINLFLVICLLFLCVGCSATTEENGSEFVPAKADGSYEAHLQQISQMEQNGDSTYISSLRTGVYREGMISADHTFECTDDGVYFVAMVPVNHYEDGVLLEGGSNARFLFFSPHDSNQVIKLCGRPDCKHDSVECNACFYGAYSGVHYYNGYLYIAIQPLEGKYMFELYRLNLDGSNRVKVGSFGDWSQYSGSFALQIIDGVVTYTLSRIDQENGETVYDRFYYALDGSMSKPAKAKQHYAHINQELMDVLMGETDEGYVQHIYSADFRKDEWTFVFDASQYSNGYWGKEAGYVLLDGAITRVHYSDGCEEVLFQTGLEGEYHTRFFPDCIVLTQTVDAAGNVPKIPLVYFYSWEGESLGELTIDFDYDYPTPAALMGGGESKDRIYIVSSWRANGLPQYYIDKSEFGTGQITLHKLEYPDFTENDYSLLFTVF